MNRLFINHDSKLLIDKRELEGVLRFSRLLHERFAGFAR